MISAVVLTRNEETRIEKCLKSLKNIVNEIIVVDDCSQDKTCKIAKNFGAKVYIRKIKGDFSAQSNFGMKKARGNWILFIDSDEIITKELAKEIRNSLQSNKLENVNAFYLRRKDFIWGRWLNHGESGSFRSLRLVKKNKGQWQRRVHQYFRVEGKTLELKNPLLHYPHPTLRDFLDSINRWSTWHALANSEEGKSSNILKIIFYPPSHFLMNFIFRLGFLDGIQGFVFAVIMSFHSFLGWSKLWIREKKYLKE